MATLQTDLAEMATKAESGCRCAKAVMDSELGVDPLKRFSAQAHRQVGFGGFGVVEFYLPGWFP